MALCLQQHDVIAAQIPSVKTRVLTSQDNVERWTDQLVWDAALQDIRIVVSTHQVLFDALSHGFVRMTRLSLLIFDEAHHCRGRHPANKIMQYHYHLMKANVGPGAVPRILGLTSSPIVRSSRQELECVLQSSSIDLMLTHTSAIESNLDAICKTPRLHRAELLHHVHMPHLERIMFTPVDELECRKMGSRLLPFLIPCIDSYDIRKDPYIEMLLQEPETQWKAQIHMMNGETYCAKQLNAFCRRSIEMYEELGGWAADYFISAAIKEFRRSVERDTSTTGIDRSERLFLSKFFELFPVLEDSSEVTHVSPKLRTLLDFLQKMDRPEFSGLIFAKQRATVSVLARILEIHPATKDRIRCAPCVGWSSHANKKDSFGDLLSQETQRDTLSEFRAGRKNLIVATDVLEEGLDVSSCSLVICFDKPANVKSFVQRRGRARHQESTYAIMLSAADDLMQLNKWQALECEMVKAYQDDKRRWLEAWEREKIDEDVREFLRVPSTNACLSADEAVQHLHHFCDVLPVDDYADSRPMFSFEEDNTGLVRGTVTLPNSVHPAVRETRGKRWWRTEQAARKETAFEAYKALYDYGLVNNNLLPLTRKPELRFTEEIELPAVVECSEQYDPYIDLAQAWSSPQLHQTSLTISENGIVNHDLSVCMVLPKHTAMPDSFPLYWEKGTKLVASFSPPEPIDTIDKLHDMRAVTAMYLQAPSSRVRSTQKDFVSLFIPVIPHDDLANWISRYEGSYSATDCFAPDDPAAAPPIGIIRQAPPYREPRLFRKWLVPENDEQPLEIECQSIPRRRNLLQASAPQMLGETDAHKASPSKISVIPAAGCTCARLPASQAMFGLFMPAILDRFEATSVAHRLNETILKGVGIREPGLRHVLTAITAPTALASTNYQLYEFFGDSVLKFTVTCQLFFTKPTWHEGYLSESRDTIIQNKRLARAALKLGLDRFILTGRFTPRKWDAPMIAKQISKSRTNGKRKLSTKILADVVEALIGAAYMDGGMCNAQTLIHRFLPEINFFTSKISSLIAPTQRGGSKLVDVESDRLASLLGYTFRDTSLITEAITHPSCEHDKTTQSYQRLEFLGDAVLDIVVVSVLAAHQDLSEGKMTQIKHSVVNANLLAFLCMDLTTDEISLWRFIRFNGPVIEIALKACIERYQPLREEIRQALTDGLDYPWELFARLRADKFMSDILESTIGAIFVDSHDLDECRAFTERIGLLPYLRRLLSAGVDVQHPRNKAQDLVKTQGTLVFKTKRVGVEAKGVDATYRSSAVLNNVEIASIEGCASSEEAEVRISNLVITKIREEQAVSDKDGAHNQQPTAHKRKRG